MRFVLLFILIPLSFFGQETKDSISTQRYFEDQFYLGLSYNFLLKHPEGSNQRNLSYGLQAGLIKDIPLNGLGTKAIGIGAGLALNSYYSNLVANLYNDEITYSINDNITRSKLETHLIEFPLEFRWRNSTVEEYKFWRIYTGIKAAYIVGARSKFVSDITSDGFYNTDLSRFQYGLTLSFGYNTFNLNAYYALTDIFNGSATVNGEVLQYRPLRIGLIFYIL
tara:strand:- start:299 stop:967 length:669 start_codon:yes stop_codon:yes gene_type:complete